VNLAEAREALAEALNTLDGLNVRARPGVKTPKSGDGWVTVGRMTPEGFTRLSVTLTALVVLSSDDTLADALLEEWAATALDAVTMADFPAEEIALEPISLPVEGTALFGFTITIITELEAPR
jgi:hypothetical protein